MTLDPTITAAQVNALIQREQDALNRLTTYLSGNPMIQYWIEVAECHAEVAALQAAATTAGITLTGLLTEPTVPSAALTNGSGTPSFLSVLAATVNTALTTRQNQDAGNPAYWARVAGG